MIQLLPSSVFLLTLQNAPQRGAPPPIVVKLIEPDTDPTGLAAVLLGVVRFTGVWVLIAVALGALFAYGLFWYRSRDNRRPDS